MPTEEQDGRQTYGDATGWSTDQRPAASEPVVPDAPAAPSAEADSSEAPVQESGSEQAPPPTSQPTPDRTFNMPPAERWEQLRREREDARQRAERAEAMAQLALQKMQTQQAPPPVPEEDPWKGLVDHPDAATARFYQQQRQLVQREAERLADAKLQGVLQQVDAGRRELAEIKIGQFRQANPEIKPGSPEEGAIATFVSQGYDLDTAKKLAMYDRLEAENRALKAKSSTVPQKRAAAAIDSSAGIPQTNGLPGKPGDWRDQVSEAIDRGGGWDEAIKVAFGGGRRR